MTDIGIDMLKMFESFRHRVYLDAADKPTIGYGHMLLNGEVFSKPISEEYGEDLLRTDILKHEQDMLHLVSVPLTDCQLDALSSFVFNLGADAFKKSTLRTCVNEGRMIDAADQFPRWVFADGIKLRGLIRRRNAEAARFLGAGPELIASIYKGGS